MKGKTLELRKKMLMLETSQERLEVLRGAFEGETAYIVAAGPSLKDYTPEYLNDVLSDKLVFSIKQSFDVLKDTVDFHFNNFVNFTNYDYGDNLHTIVPFIIWDQQHPHIIMQNNIRCDFMIPNFRNDSFPKFDSSVCAKGDFDSLLFDSQFERPWGPGTMYEMCIPTGILMGVKKFVLVGWDIGDPNMEEFDKTRCVWQEHSYDPSRVQFGKFEMTKEEILLVADSTKNLFYWLKDKGIKLEMTSKINPGYTGIPRIEL